MNRLSRVLAAVLLALPLLAAPKRIISLSPNTTEMLAGVGAFSNVVAVSEYCSYPPEVRNLPRVGGWQTTHVEKIVALRPDLVLMTQAQEPFLAERLRAFSIPYTAVPSESLADVFAAIEMVGHATSHEAQAASLVRSTRESLDRIRTKAAALPHPSVLLCVNRTPGTLSELYVATAGSYLIDLIELTGGKSVVKPAKSGYGKVSKEAILALNPDVVIDLVHSSKTPLGEQPLDAWKDLPELTAVRRGAIHPVDDPFVPHPSQFVTHTAELFFRLLHGQAASAGTR